MRGADHGGLKPREVATMLGCADRAVYGLIAVRQLRTCTVINPINRCPQVVIMPEELARFQREYVSLFALAKERGLHFRRVQRELDDRGLEPAFKAEEIGARFYKREDLNSGLTGITDMAEGDVRHVGYADRDQSR